MVAKRKDVILMVAKQPEDLLCVPVWWGAVRIYFATRGNSSVGRAQPCQGWGRGFESRFPLSVGQARVGVWRLERLRVRPLDHRLRLSPLYFE